MCLPLIWCLDYVIHSFSPAAKRKILAELQEVKVSTTASSAKHSELAEALKAYRAKAENYLSRLEQADIERAKAVNGEKFGTL